MYRGQICNLVTGCCEFIGTVLGFPSYLAANGCVISQALLFCVHSTELQKGWAPILQSLRKFHWNSKQNCWLFWDLCRTPKKPQLFFFTCPAAAGPNNTFPTQPSDFVRNIWAKRRTWICFQLQMRPRCLCKSANIAGVLSAPGLLTSGFP